MEVTCNADNTVQPTPGSYSRNRSGSPHILADTLHKPLPLLPSTSGSSIQQHLEDVDGSSSTSIQSSVCAQALSAFVSFERNYASDLAIISDICIPLASEPLDVLHEIQQTMTTSPLSMVLDSLRSTFEKLQDRTGPTCMTQEDVRLLFSNISDIAGLADTICGDIEDALNEGGESYDHMGRLLVNRIPLLELLYTKYIAKLPDALRHLKSIRHTPAATYIGVASRLLSSLSNAGGLTLYLHQPLEHLMKYPTMVSAIIEEVPIAHEDREYLLQARSHFMDIIRTISLEHDRRESTKRILSRMDSGMQSIPKGSPSRNGAITAALAVVIHLRVIGRSRTEGSIGKNAEERIRTAHSKHLCEGIRARQQFVHNFAKEALTWTDQMQNVIKASRRWTSGFGRICSIDDGINSEGFSAFAMAVHSRIPELHKQLRLQVTQLFEQLDNLVRMAEAPLRLFETMQSLEASHHGYLRVNERTPKLSSQLVDSSKTYFALREQLEAEAPRFLCLFSRGIDAAVLCFIRYQSSLYEEMHATWNDIWESLGGGDEPLPLGVPHVTLSWSRRWRLVYDEVNKLEIIRPPGQVPGPAGKRQYSDAPNPPLPSYYHRLGVTSFHSDAPTLIGAM